MSTRIGWYDDYESIMEKILKPSVRLRLWDCGRMYELSTDGQYRSVHSNLLRNRTGSPRRRIRPNDSLSEELLDDYLYLLGFMSRKSARKRKKALDFGKSSISWSPARRRGIVCRSSRGQTSGHHMTISAWDNSMHSSSTARCRSYHEEVTWRTFFGHYSGS